VKQSASNENSKTGVRQNFGTFKKLQKMNELTKEEKEINTSSIFLSIFPSQTLGTQDVSLVFCRRQETA